MQRLRTLEALKWTRLLKVMLIILCDVLSMNRVTLNMESCLYKENNYSNVVDCEGNPHMVERVHQVFRQPWGGGKYEV